MSRLEKNTSRANLLSIPSACCTDQPRSLDLRTSNHSTIWAFSCCVLRHSLLLLLIDSSLETLWKVTSKTEHWMIRIVCWITLNSVFNFQRVIDTQMDVVYELNRFKRTRFKIKLWRGHEHSYSILEPFRNIKCQCQCQFAGNRICLAGIASFRGICPCDVAISFRRDWSQAHKCGVYIVLAAWELGESARLECGWTTISKCALEIPALDKSLEKRNELRKRQQLGNIVWESWEYEMSPYCWQWCESRVVGEKTGSFVTVNVVHCRGSSSSFSSG